MSRASGRASLLLLLLLAAPLLLTQYSSASAVNVAQKQSEADKQAQKGAEYLGKKDWKRAVDSYQKALRADARHVEANYGLGLAYLNLKQPNEALAAFSKVIEAKPNPRVKDALLNTGVIHFALARYKEAADAIALAVPLGDIGAEGHYFLGKAYMLTGRDADALASLERATGNQQYAQDAFFSVGLVRLKQNKPREAIMPLEQAVRLNPKHSPSLMLLGNAYVATERNAEGEKLLRQSLALDPNQSFAHYGLGYALLNMNRIEEALASFTVALRLQPQSPEALIGLGYAHTRLNRFREAQGFFEQAMRLNPNAAEPLIGICVVHYSQGQYPALLSTAQQAARLAPQNANAQTMLAAAYATVGQMREATAAVRVALGLEPDNYWPHHVLGFIMVREDNLKEALAEARAGVRLMPSLPETQNLLAYVLNQLGQHTEALQAAEAALQNKRDPVDEGWAFYNLATAQEKLGRAEESRASFAASIKAYNQTRRTLDPDDLYLMGNAYLRLEQDVPAIKAFSQAIRVRPNFPQARYNLGVTYIATGNRKGAQDEHAALRRIDPARAAKLLAIINGKPGRK